MIKRAVKESRQLCLMLLLVFSMVLLLQGAAMAVIDADTAMTLRVGDIIYYDNSDYFYDVGMAAMCVGD